jgi:hypothetical protein
VKKYHHIQSVKFTIDDLLLKVDGKEYVFKISDVSEKLAKASEIERKKYEISPSGYGIHWPMIDEDLSIDGLLDITHTSLKIKEKRA